MNLLDAYQQYNELNIYPYHMPGHKRNTELCRMPNPYEIDYTEIDGLDDLREAAAHPGRGSLLDRSMARASKMFGSKYSFYLVGGSTSGLICSILACTKRGDRVLIPRNCHKSVYNALALASLHPVYIYPSVDEEIGIYANLRPEDVEKALNEYPDIKLVVTVSPTFYGVVSDIAEISEVCHAHGVPLMVDEAHGPHMGLSEYFPDSAVHQGADIVVQSLHKTLPVLTQTSILHVCSDLVDHEAVSRTIAIIESSSPSFVLVASADQCLDLLEKRGPELFEIYHKRLRQFSDDMRGLKHLTVLCNGNDTLDRHPNIYRYDHGKILISTRGTNMTGSELYHVLLDKYRLQMEMCLADMVLAMTSIADTQEGFDRLRNALLEIDASLDEGKPGERFMLKQHTFEVSPLSPDEAYALPGEFVKPEEAVGRIAREFVYAYPPGIPYFVPGEIIDPDTMATIMRMEKADIKLISTRHRYPELIEVCIIH